METSIAVTAPAKINLHLRVLGRRPDGFHDIRSLFQAVSLADDIVLRSLKRRGPIEIEGSFDCPPERTTLFKAAALFREAVGSEEGLSIRVTKRIPAGAGLGGGSSDGAAVLLALEELHGRPLGARILAELAARIGSDVPFFLHGGTAYVTGRGESIEAFPALAELPILLVHPDRGMSTPKAYAAIDRLREGKGCEPFPSEAEERLEALEALGRRPRDWCFVNSFEDAVFPELPGLAEAKSALGRLGADFRLMTGSGSTLFAVFEDRDLALRALAELRGLLPEAWRPALHGTLARGIVLG